MGTRVTAAKAAALRENLTAILGELESGRIESSEKLESAAELRACPGGTVGSPAPRPRFPSNAAPHDCLNDHSLARPGRPAIDSVMAKPTRVTVESESGPDRPHGNA